MTSMLSNISRAITKFSYMASKETQGRLAKMQKNPLEIFMDTSQYLELLNELKRNVVEKSILIKDPEKTIHQIDEIVNSIPSLSSDLKDLEDELSQLESSVNSNNMRYLDETKAKAQRYEKYYSECISNIEETEKNIDEIDSSLTVLKQRIEDNALYVTNRKYSILRPQE